MSSTIKLKKGFDINLAGKAAISLGKDIHPETYSLKPTDFPGIQRAKVLVSEGDTVKAGTPIMIDKKMDRVIYSAPVSGEVVEINRGEKRKLLEVKILADREVEFESFKTYSPSDITSATREQIVEHLLLSGVWPNIVQRPFGIVANPDQAPKSIFISGFDTHPLAPDYGFLLQGQEKYLQAGIDVLRKLTEGSVNLGINGVGEIPAVYSQLQNVEVNKISGPHPAGNVGVHIHHIDPISKGELVWTVNPVGVVQIGKSFLEGKHDTSKIVSLVGSEITTPGYHKTYSGASVSKFLADNVSDKSLRVISGNVLTGESIGENGSLGFYDNMVTVIPEGGDGMFLGWLLPSTKLFSFHRALGLMSFLWPKREVVLDSSTWGEERAFVMSGAFEKVTPMDLYPTHLIKAILAEDYDDMESLGIFEVVEEDLALCEFIDVSKHEVQAIVREGIDLMINS